MDNPSSESSLSIDAAASAFVDFIDPPEVVEEVPQVDTEVDPPKKPEAKEAPQEQEAEENASEEGADAPITVEVDGKQVTLTKEQIAEAYKGQLRQSDYTQKTMAAAEARKAAEAETQKAMQERVTYAQNLQKMAAQLEGAIQQQDKIDWNALLESDPVEFMRQKHLSEQRQAALQKNQQELQSLAQQHQAEQAKTLQAHLAKQQDELLAKLPEWKDEAKAKSERDALKAYLTEQGYEPEAINNINDHRAVILGRKAMLYDQMMAKAQAAAKKVANVPTKVVRPGVATGRDPVDGRSSAMRNHAKNGTIDSAAELFAKLL